MRKSTFIFIVLSGLASVFNYAVYPILARLLDANEFVQIAVALALFTQISSFMLSIVALTIGLSKQEGEKKSKETVEKLQAILTHLFVVLIICFLATSPLFLKRIDLPAPLLVPICIMLGLSISMSIISGYLNGKQKLVKLGIAIALSSGLQLLFSVLIAVITKSGAATLNAMAFGSFMAIVLTYWFYRSEKLPQLSSIFSHGISLYQAKSVRSLVTFTISSAVATLIMNLLLIADLLLVSGRQVDTKLYTDMYVVSRAVFFAGMLFVWPFLSNIDIRNTHQIRGLFYRLLALFVLLASGASLIMSLFGRQVLELLLGSDYGQRVGLKQLAILAIAYKFTFLVLSTLVLFFIVIRSYWAVALPIVLASLIGLGLLIFGERSTTYLVANLNITSAITLLIGAVGFLQKTRHSPPTSKGV